MSKQDVAKKFLTEQEVEAEYGLGTRFLRLRRMDPGANVGPPYRKISGDLGRKGGRILYPREGLERWLASRPGGGEQVEAVG